MATILSVLMLVAAAMVAGAIWQWRRFGLRKQVWLMLLAAVVMIVNVLIWTVPDSAGSTLIEQSETAPG